MFQKLLIANRGEIACRIIKTARKLGIKTVAVYSDADRDGLHVRMADEAVAIGPPPAAQSYLLIDKIVEACRTDRCRGRAPGLWFPVGTRSLCPRVGAGRYRFHRPEPQGDRRHGRQDREQEGGRARPRSRPCPAISARLPMPSRRCEIAGEIGYPVMIKASAGGGGKGMRVAYAAGGRGGLRARALGGQGELRR